MYSYHPIVTAPEHHVFLIFDMSSTQRADTTGAAIFHAVATYPLLVMYQPTRLVDADRRSYTVVPINFGRFVSPLSPADIPRL